MDGPERPTCFIFSIFSTFSTFSTWGPESGKAEEYFLYFLDTPENEQQKNLNQKHVAVDCVDCV